MYPEHFDKYIPISSFTIKLTWLSNFHWFKVHFSVRLNYMTMMMIFKTLRTLLYWPIAIGVRVRGMCSYMCSVSYATILSVIKVTEAIQIKTIYNRHFIAHLWCYDIKRRHSLYNQFSCIIYFLICRHEHIQRWQISQFPLSHGGLLCIRGNAVTVRHDRDLLCLRTVSTEWHTVESARK